MSRHDKPGQTPTDGPIRETRTSSTGGDEASAHAACAADEQVAARWLLAPGARGAMGALMDEYARAADAFCAVAETIGPEAWVGERPGPDARTRSPRTICTHVCGAAHRYADGIRKARGLPHDEGFKLPPGVPATPADVRPLLRDALQYTEGALDGLHDADEETVGRITFVVPWGVTYDPDMLLEHAVMHLLRHRRQLLRWRASPGTRAVD